MIKLLTVDQKRLVLDTIKDIVLWQPIVDVEGKVHDTGATYEDLYRAIERCTEKPFPLLNMMFEFQNNDNVNFRIRELDRDYHCEDPVKRVIMRVEHKGLVLSWAATLKELNYFANACGDILEWFEEQE